MTTGRKPPRVLAAHRSGRDTLPYDENGAENTPKACRPQVLDDTNPSRMGNYLDVTPSDRQRALLCRIHDVTGSYSRSAIAGMSGSASGRVPAYLVKSLVNNQSILAPGYPLFSDPRAGTLSVPGGVRPGSLSQPQFP
jgi:hypothetical protein